MSDNLGNFLVDLACDPQLMSRFIGDPAAVLGESALTEHERSLVLARDARGLADALGSAGYALGVGIEVIPPAKKAPPKKKKAPGRKKRAPGKKKTPPKKTPVRKSPRKPASRTRH